MLIEIPVSPIANQRFSLELDKQQVEIELRQIGPALMCSVWVDEQVVFQNSICGNISRVGQFKSNLFDGVLFFVDTQGTSDPVFTGLGERYKFYFASVDDEFYSKVESV